MRNHYLPRQTAASSFQAICRTWGVQFHRRNRSSSCQLQGSALRGSRRRYAALRRQLAQATGTEPPKLQSVTELVLLVKVKDECSEETCEELLDSLWSLQYKTGPSILCAFAGPITASDAHGHTHGVHFRFNSLKAAEAFQQHPQFLKVQGEQVAAACTGQTCLTFESRVPRELEEIFRRGSEWDVGTEHILLTQAASDLQCEEATAYNRQLAEIATSSLAGAFQSIAGKLQQASAASMLPGLQGTGSGECHVLMSRFETKTGLAGFLALPPLERLMTGDEGLPVKLLLSTAFRVAPAEKSNSSTPGVNRLAS